VRLAPAPGSGRTSFQDVRLRADRAGAVSIARSGARGAKGQRLLARDTVPRLDQIREGFVDAAWRGLFWIAWIALPVNIWRAWEIGWTLSFTIVLIAVAGAIAVHALRERLSLGVKSALLLFIRWFAGLAGVSSFGIAGPSITLLTTNGFVAAMILPQRRALVVIAGGLLTLACAGTAYVQGWVKPTPDLNQFSAMASSWSTWSSWSRVCR
jgi:hypothetical protein